MFLEDLLAGLSGGLRGFGQAYSFEETDRKNRDERDQLRRDRLNQQGVEQMYRDYDIQENARRYGEQQKQARAGVAASQLAPNQAIDDLTYSFLQGTPYEARVQSTETLPSRGNYSMMGGTDLVDPGGELSRTWRPTWAESRALAEEGARSELLSDPSMARYAPRIRAGLGPIELPNERAEREAAGDQATQDRALALEDVRNGNVLEQIKLRARLGEGRAQGPQPGYQWVMRNGKQVYTNQVQDGDVPASRTGGGRNVTSGDAQDLADFDTSLDDLRVLRDTVAPIDPKTGKAIESGATGTIAKMGAAAPNWWTNATGLGTESKKKQAVIDRVKQVIGKTLEGGVLRKEDELKYEKILPTIYDTADVVRGKLDGLEKAIGLRKQRRVDSLADAGFDVSKYAERAEGGAGPVTPRRAAPAADAKAATPQIGETRRLKDGTRVRVTGFDADGKVLVEPVR
jgi:hypothetical protein